MEHRNRVLVLLATVFFTVIASFAYVQTVSDQPLRLSLRSDKVNYNLGEPIQFSFELSNEGKDTLILQDVFGTATGNLHLEISTNDRDFVGFDNPLWGRIDTVGETLIDPNRSFEALGKVLWVVSKDGDPGFRLTKPGDYFIRARYSVWLNGKQEPKNITSERIKITVDEPIGEDLEVWNKIRVNGNFAYFICEADVRIPGYKSEERTKFLQEVEQILTDYPNSFYSQSLRQSLDKFRASEAKKQEFLQRLQKQKPQ